MKKLILAATLAVFSAGAITPALAYTSTEVHVIKKDKEKKKKKKKKCCTAEQGKTEGSCSKSGETKSCCTKKQ